MSAPSLLLIEQPHGLGAHDADAALRVRALKRAGWSARVHALDAGDARGLAAAARETAARVVAERPAEVWVAGSHAAWQAVAASLPSGRTCAWWPTLVPGCGGETPPRSRAHLVAPPSGADESHAAFELAPVRPAGDRAPVALWDGEFVLAPGRLEGTEGERLLRAFAAAAAERPELDLVVLADPYDEITSIARALGLGPRVHCAGHAPREAEHTWNATAAAVMLPTRAPVTAGLVLRILAAGTPLVVDPTAATAAPLVTWLTAQGLAPDAHAARQLEASLAHEPRIRAACVRGRKLTAWHDPDGLAARLPAARGRDGGHERHAA